MKLNLKFNMNESIEIEMVWKWYSYSR